MHLRHQMPKDLGTYRVMIMRIFYKIIKLKTSLFCHKNAEINKLHWIIIQKNVLHSLTLSHLFYTIIF